MYKSRDNIVRKTVYLVFILITFVGFVCFAQNTNFKHYSSIGDGDFKNNFSGYAYAS